MIYTVETYTELVEWVAALKNFCVFDSRLADWKKIDLLQAVQEVLNFIDRKIDK